MQILRGLEEWGRARTLSALTRLLPTRETSASDAGQTLKSNPWPRILFIGIYQHMGQFLCATPLIRAFKSAWPKATLQFLGNPVNAAAAQANPHLARVWVWKKSAIGKWPAQIRALRKERFDLALLLTTERPSATGILLARALGARWVAAYTSSIPGAWAQDATALCHIRIPSGAERNEVEKYLGLARAFEVPSKGREPEFVPSERDQAAADTYLSQQTFADKGPLVGLFIGGKAERTDRLWPISHFAKLADSLKRAGFRVIVLSPPPSAGRSNPTYQSEEHLRLAEFRRALSWECPAFQEPELGRVAAFLRRLDLLVCPDGGILHLAAAVGTSTCGLFFSTDPEVWRHEIRQTHLDGRGHPSADLSPEVVAKEIGRFLGVSAIR